MPVAMVGGASATRARGCVVSNEVGDDLRNPLIYFAHRTSDFLGSGGLFRHRAGDRGLDMGDVTHDRRHGDDGELGGIGALLHGVHLGVDAHRGFGTLPREILDLIGHHGEATAGVTGTGRLDGGIERQQVGANSGYLFQVRLCRRWNNFLIFKSSERPALALMTSVCTKRCGVLARNPIYSGRQVC